MREIGNIIMMCSCFRVCISILPEMITRLFELIKTRLGMVGECFLTHMEGRTLMDTVIFVSCGPFGCYFKNMELTKHAFEIDSRLSPSGKILEMTAG